MDGFSSGNRTSVIQGRQIELHFAHVFGFELGDFEFNGHETFEDAMIEQHVDKKLVAVDLQVDTGCP